MTNTFYIQYKESYDKRTWYMLIVKDTHYCLSCGSDLSVLIRTLKNTVKTYRSKERLLKALRGLSDSGTISPATFEQREQWYRLYGEDYEDLVHSTVLEALHEAKEEDKENSPLRKTTNRLKKVGKVFSPVSQAFAEGLDKTTKDSPKFLGKPRVFNRK